MESYEQVKEWKNDHMRNVWHEPSMLNAFHDDVMLAVMKIAIRKVGEAPCHFSWFITGSGGRGEQGIISDQDHGIIFERNDDEIEKYFLTLGEEVSYGLDVVGYPYCQGYIMSSNPVWCKSYEAWERQLQDWLLDEGWEKIRYLQILFDARTLIGQPMFIESLKQHMLEFIQQKPIMLERFIKNIEHVKPVIGPFGQILVERYGEYQGCIDLKYAAFLPYVNAIRLLSIKEHVLATSTIERIRRLIQLKDYQMLLVDCEVYFLKLLQYRLSLSQSIQYTDTHYFQVDTLPKEEKRQLKQILKTGKRLHDEAIEAVKKGVRNGI